MRFAIALCVVGALGGASCAPESSGPGGGGSNGGAGGTAGQGGAPAGAGGTVGSAGSGGSGGSGGEGGTCGPGSVPAQSQAGFAQWPIPNHEPLEPTQASLTDNGDGTVRDNVTGLVWQQTLEDGGAKNWAAAISQCEDLVLASCGDWRLPSRMELLSIVDRTKANPAIDGAAFPGTPSARFWSSSAVGGVPSDAWDVDFDNGNTNRAHILGTARVRCVR